jgi:hypothetical protein
MKITLTVEKQLICSFKLQEFFRRAEFALNINRYIKRNIIVPTNWLVGKSSTD